MEDIPMNNNRVLVIGLDGASWNVLNPLMAAGKLPNLAHLVQEGASGLLRSTIPPVTAPAWVSFSTGVNPGKHGVFSFKTRGEDGRLTDFVSSRSVRSPRLWQLLSHQGKSVTVINVPVTYPPEPVNGLMVSGMLTPGRDSQFTHPSELRDEILSFAPDYVTDVNLLTGGRTLTTVKEKLDFVGETYSAMHSRSIVARHMMTQYPWDLFMVVFVTMDRIQHVLWRYLEPGDIPPPGQEQILPAVHDLYSSLDASIGQLIANAGQEVKVVIMSDHGFGQLHGAININRWLQKQKLLVFNEAKGNVRGWLMRLSQIIRWRSFVPESLRGRLRAPFDQEECIDWAQTKAYSGSPIEQGIFINTPDRRQGGIVRTSDEAERIKKEISLLLPQLKDPATSMPAIEAVYDASELLTGPYVSQAPDLIYTPRDSGYLTNAGTPDLGLFDRGDYWIEGGYHHPDGILIAQGPDVKQGIEITGANIVDVAPTILHMLNTSIPKHFDGIVLQNLFHSSFLKTHPIQFTDVSFSDGEQDASLPYSESESEIIHSRLRSLGYLD